MASQIGLRISKIHDPLRRQFATTLSKIYNYPNPHFDPTNERFVGRKPRQPDNDGANRWRFYFLCGLAGLVPIWYHSFYVGDHPDRPEFIPYRHLRLRNRPFPWGDGDHSLFHHPYFNALPDGYEDGYYEEEEE